MSNRGLEQMQPATPRREGEIEQTINRLGNQKDQLNSVTVRLSRVAGELFGPTPPTESTKDASESVGLIGALSRSLDDTDAIILELMEVVERIESLA